MTHKDRAQRIADTMRDFKVSPDQMGDYIKACDYLCRRIESELKEIEKLTIENACKKARKILKRFQ